MTPPIVLASASPRRKQLLGYIVDSFTQISADIDETPLLNETPKQLVSRLATSKAQFIQNTHADSVVIGSDTVVAIDEKILGKPLNYNDFLAMMATLSGSVHNVYTGVSILYKDTCLSETIVTKVIMSEITKIEAQNYWATNEPQDKAGGYAIQGIGGQFVKSIEGSFSAVVGLPIHETKYLLTKILKDT